MAYEDAVVPVVAGAHAPPGQSGGFSTDGGDTLNVIVNVTVAATSVVVEVQWSDDGGATWASAETADAFASIAATGVKAKSFQVKAPMARISWTGTGTFSFSVSTYLTH